MSYQRIRLVHRVKRPHGHRHFVAMGDTVTVWGNQYDCTNLTDADKGNSFVVAACDAADAGYSRCAGQADTDTAPIDAMAMDLAKNWQPTGTYAPADIRKLVTQAMATTRTGYDAVDAARASAPQTQQDLLSQEHSNLDDIGKRALDYLAAATAADAAKSSVDAPGMKQFVLDTYNATSSAIHASSVVMCQVPTWIIILQSVITACQAFSNVVKGIAGVVLKVGEKAIAAVEGGLDLIATVEKIAPFAIVGLAAWWIFLREKKRKA